ncbi:hypothetical protein Tcan_01000, partial [Toxocara canis]
QKIFFRQISYSSKRNFCRKLQFRVKQKSFLKSYQIELFICIKQTIHLQVPQRHTKNESVGKKFKKNEGNPDEHEATYYLIVPNNLGHIGSPTAPVGLRHISRPSKGN